jgi:CheY-like chemotaxis protein
MSYTILIVDDSATTRAMIKRTIRMTDLPVSALYDAPDGKAALELIAKTKINLVLADLNMPEMDGFEMTRRLRADSSTREIPVIVVSAAPNAEDFAKLEHVSACLRKPFTPEAIRNAISRAMEVAHA